MFRLIIIALLAYWAVGTSALAERVTLKLDDAQNIARAAFLRQDFALANALANGLLQANPDDTRALLLIAATSPVLGRTKEGFEAGKKAFRGTKNPGLRFEAAYYTALAAARQDRFGKSKYWLRRAHNLAQTPQQKSTIARQFRTIRARDPLSINLQFSVVPSSNINNGSENAFLTVDGVPFFGALSADAQALSGVRYSTGATLGYRLDETKTRKTSLGFRAIANFYSLSSSAKARAPGARDKDYNNTFTELSITHQRVPDSPFLPDRYMGSIGGTWYGGNENYRFARLAVSRSYLMANKDALTIDASRTFLHYSNDQDATQSSLGVRYRHKAQNGNLFSMGVRYQNGRADNVNSTYEAVEATAFLGFAKPFGPAQIDLSLTIGKRDYARYTIPFFPTPDGRKDTYAYGAVGLSFPSIDYYGFIPRVSVQTTRISSNISRFDQRAFSVDLGLKSAF